MYKIMDSNKSDLINSRTDKKIFLFICSGFDFVFCKFVQKDNEL